VKNKGIPHVPHEVNPKGQLGKVKRIPYSVGGRRAHPPKPGKKIVELLNKKEHAKALASALSFCADREAVCTRMNVEIGVSLPIVLEDGFEKLSKTRDVAKLFKALNLTSFIEKAKKNGTHSALIVVSDSASVKAGRNLAGVEVVKAGDLEVRHLAPGTHPGMLTLFCESALPEIAKRFEA
jgi:large subunit ribosomal protein L4e